MCGMVGHYLIEFSRLLTEEGKTGGSDLIGFGKPLLLMAVLDLIAQGRLQRNFVEPSQELVRRFQDYQKLLPAAIGWVNLAEPFVGLGSESFWHLRPRGRQYFVDQSAITSVERLRECCFGAKFSDDLFPLLQMQTSRKKLRDVLVESYFSLELQQGLRDYSSQPFTVSE